MTDVFGIAAAAGGEFLRAAAIDAGYELGVFDAVRDGSRSIDELAVGLGKRRLRALLELLVAIGSLAREGERFAIGAPPVRPVVPRAGWGAMASVIRGDRAHDVAGGEIELRYHRHLLQVGAGAARELALILPDESLIDLGGGAGTYSLAYLDAHPGARVTLVDFHEVIALARVELARFGDRARLISGEIGVAKAGDGYRGALLSNVLHLHSREMCARLVASAAARVAPGGMVVIKDLRIEEDRSGPLQSLMFALNMAIYTGEGDVYEASQLRAWLEAAGLIEIEERRLACSPDAIVMIGRKPRGAAAVFDDVTGLGEAAATIADELDAAVTRAGEAAWRELGRDGEAPPSALPSPLRRMLAHAIAHDRTAPLAAHYTDVMPRQRLVQLAGPAEPGASLFHTRLDWNRLPRMRAAIGRLFAVLDESGVTTGMLGVSTIGELCATTSTLADLYVRTHYGGCMPLLYGYPADLAYFTSRGLDPHATIDRYLTAPILHELCHFAPVRDALPPHLDECIAGWLAVYVWPEFAYPAAGHDDAIYAAPWLSQIGQAFARAFGIAPIVRAQAGAIAWQAALTPPVVETLARFAWDDWRARRTSHFLSDTFDPDPWVTLAWSMGHARDDADFDRAIVGDALRSMCLDNLQIDGSFRVRTRVPEVAIEIDARTRQVTCANRGSMDRVSPRYWLPPAVATRMLARGHAGYELWIGSVEAIPAVVRTLCDGAEPSNFAIMPREIGDTGR